MTVHDEYNLIGLPGGTIDARLGIPKESLDGALAGYRNGRFGLYVLQCIGPPLPLWLNEVRAEGGVVVQPVPVNAYLVALTPEIAAKVSQFTWVQFLEIYHPFLKAAAVDPVAIAEQDVLVELAEAPNLDDAIADVTAVLGNASKRKDRGGLYLMGKMKVADLQRLLAEPLVIGVHRRPQSRLSDERQAMSLSSNIGSTPSGNPNIPNLVPTQPGTYSSWLTGACSVCGNLSNEGFIVGVADTGVDTGSTGVRHPDLQPVARVRYGAVFLTERDGSGTCPPAPEGQPRSVCEFANVCLTCDGSFHGTFVSGVVAGNAATGKRDTNQEGLGFFLGTGAVPTAGILSTKIGNAGGAIWNGRNIYNWASDATSRFVYIQNHSHNEYVDPLDPKPTVAGMYTQMSREFDFAVRDSDGAGPLLTPITLTVSAGNRHQDNHLLGLLPPATAKNVIAVGGAENVRDPSEWRACESPLYSDHATSLRNIMEKSKHGTLVESGGNGWDTYAKPDVFAPASQITSTRSPLRNLPQCWRLGASPNFDLDYNIATGTSFSAPFAAGAALVSSRVYAATLPGPLNPAAASPALLKAMLIAGTRSMRGGLDRATTGSPEIGPRPNAVQGFGRISLTEIVSPTPARQYYNQEHTFTNSGQTWSRTYPVSDTTLPVKIVLTWTDAPAQAGLGSVPTFLMNDLDLMVSAGHSTNCLNYAGNNLQVIDPEPQADLNRGEESTLYTGCVSGNPDTKNNAEIVIFHPTLAGVTQFTVEVRARQVTYSAIPDTACGGSDCFDQDFALFVYNAGSPVSLAAPSNLAAAATTATSVNVSWSPVTGAQTYEVSRRSSGGFTVIGNTALTSLSDASASANTAYLYRVRALDPASNPGAYSNTDMATTILFTDDPLTAGATVIKGSLSMSSVMRSMPCELRQACLPPRSPIPRLEAPSPSKLFMCWSSARISTQRVPLSGCPR